MRCVKELLYKYGTLLALVVAIGVFAFSSPVFLSLTNMFNILIQISLLSIISVGFTMALIVDNLDLSFASIASLSSVITAGLMFGGAPVIPSVLAGIGVGIGMGMVNGLLVTLLGLESLIATLATGTIIGGLTFMYTRGVSFYGQLPNSFTVLGRGYVGPVPMLVIIMVVVTALAHIFVKHTIYGHNLVATGENRAVARLTGINTKRYIFLGLMLSGTGAGLTGVLLTAKLSSSAPDVAAIYLMQAIAASLLGMSMFTPGRANILGTFFGALLLGVMNNGLTLVGAIYYLQAVVQGIIILVAMSIAGFERRRRA